MEDASRSRPPPLREWRAWLARAASHDAHPLIQFVKYGMAGGVALVTDVVFFTLANLYLFPIEPGTGGGMAPDAGLMERMREVGGDPAVWNYVRCNLVGFVMSNAVGYVLNVKWVFRGGRHRRHMEILLFLAASVAAFLVGTALGGYLVGRFGLNEYLAKGGNVVAAVLINYVCRKFVVFHG